MLAVLNSDIYLLTARRRNHLILRLDSFLGDGAATYDLGLLTIEHVLPQTVNPGSNWALPALPMTPRNDRLANLVPLTQKRNSQALNYDFDVKMSAYLGGKHGVSSYRLTTQVLKTSEWTPELVAQRQLELIELLTSKWDLGEVKP